MKHEGLTFPEAARTLAAEVGIEIEEERGAGDTGITQQIFEANELAQDLYREALVHAGRQDRAGLPRFGGFDGKAADEFGIGYAPARWDAVATRLREARIKGKPPSKADSSRSASPDRATTTGFAGGSLSRSRMSADADRVRRARARAGPGTRVLEHAGDAGLPQAPRALRLPRCPRTDPARQARDPVRGLLRPDRLCAGRDGQALATCGTALTPDHGAQLRRRTRKWSSSSTATPPDRPRPRRRWPCSFHGLRVRAALIPGGADPDDYLNDFGADALKKLVDEAPDALELSIRNALRHELRLRRRSPTSSLTSHR